MQFDTGLRLEFQPPAVRELALALMRASLSAEGYRLAHGMMLINGFLGETVGLETVLNEFSYNFAIYGEPDLLAPWGWQLFGHHCAVNCLVIDGRMVLSPVFLGAEPNAIDAGPHAGVTSFTERIELGTALMAALPADQRRAATVYEQMVDPAMPPGRVHPGDERHLAGAFQDNRIIPVEGVRVADMPSAAADLVMAIAEQFVALLPGRPARSPAAGNPRTPAADLVLLDRRAPARRRLLLPHPVPGDHRRARPPLRGLPRLRHPAAVPRPHRAAHPARQRLRPRLRSSVAARQRSAPRQRARPDTVRRQLFRSCLPPNGRRATASGGRFHRSYRYANFRPDIHRASYSTARPDRITPGAGRIVVPSRQEKP